MTAPPLSRRRLLSGAVKLAVAASASPLLAGCASPERNLFSLGVASGDPLPDGVVLWTRLAPDPLGGAPAARGAIPVRWQIASDERFAKVVANGTALALPEHAHSVHVDARGLQPGRWYWYRFRAGQQLSPVGRTKTAPAPHAMQQEVRFAFASCQNYQHGYYAAYEDMAAQELDCVIHLGDYIYETEPHAVGPRIHVGGEAVTLQDYRNRHALYRTDLDLQAAHAAFPFVVVPDDHELEDNYAAWVPQEGSDTPDAQSFARRRENAYRAYWEHQPLRGTAAPAPVLYRRLSFGRLASFNVLDTRSYRSDQPCGDGVKRPCRAAFDAAASMTGAAQERWLLEGLRASEAVWNVIGSQTLFAQVRFDDPTTSKLSMDAWDGYPAARRRLTSSLAGLGVRNPVVISGDTHASWVSELRADFDREDTPTIGVEFGGPSITSESPPDYPLRVTRALPFNPHVRFFDAQGHGYVRCALDADTWRADYRVVETTQRRHAPGLTLASFEVNATVAGGSPGVRRLA
jgi:alkaline phosphatase D